MYNVFHFVATAEDFVRVIVGASIMRCIQSECLSSVLTA